MEHYENIKMSPLSTPRARAFEKLFQKHYARIYTFAARMVGDADAEDIVGDIFLKLWSEKIDLTHVEYVGAYLRRATMNACVDHIRRLKTKAKIHHQILEKLETEQEEVFIHAQMKAEIMEAIQQQLATMPAKFQRVFRLSYVEGKGIEEITQELNITAQTLYNIRSQILKALKIYFRDKGSLAIVFFLFLAELKSF